MWRFSSDTTGGIRPTAARVAPFGGVRVHLARRRIGLRSLLDLFSRHSGPNECEEAFQIRPAPNFKALGFSSGKARFLPQWPLKPLTCPLDPQRQDLELPHRWDTRQEDHYFAALNGMLFPFKLETPPQSLEEDSDICSNVLRATSDKDRACAQENLLVSQGAAIRREY
jgi:hypothetical protein